MKHFLALAPAVLVAGLTGSSWLTAEAAEAAPARADAAPVSYAIDPTHSFVHFRIGHLGIGMAYGRFDAMSGSIEYDAEDPAASTISVEIDAASVNTGSADRDKHLRGADFFSVREFPKITFTSQKITQSKDGYKITGELSMHGQTKQVVADGRVIGAGKDPWGNQRVGVEAQFTVNRMDYGVDYMPDGLGKEVTVMVAFEGVQRAEG